MQCIIMENTLIKLTLHDETKKRAHDSQIVRTKENLKLSHEPDASSRTDDSFSIRRNKTKQYEDPSLVCWWDTKFRSEDRRWHKKDKKGKN